MIQFNLSRFNYNVRLRMLGYCWANEIAYSSEVYDSTINDWVKYDPSVCEVLQSKVPPDQDI